MVIGLDQVVRETQRSKRVIEWNPFRIFTRWLERFLVNGMHAAYLQLQGLVVEMEKSQVYGDTSDFEYLTKLESKLTFICEADESPQSLKMIAGKMIPLVHQVGELLINVDEMSDTELLQSTESSRNYLNSQMAEVEGLEESLNAHNV